jgi:starch synthase
MTSQTQIAASRASEQANSVAPRSQSCSVLISHPTGNQNVRNAVLSLAERGMLAEFWTTIAWNRESAINSILPARVKAQLERRSFTVAPREKIRCVPLREVVRLALSNTSIGCALCGGERPFSVIGMYRHFDATVANQLSRVRPDVVYAYEGGALNTFRKAKSLGITTIYELPSSYWHWATELFREEGERNPAFAAIIPKLRDSAAHTQWKDAELKLADVVVVPSEHVRATLGGAVPDSKIRVVPYGAPEPRSRSELVGVHERLRVLYVGNLSQGKGISYLLDAIRSLGDCVELTLIGRRFADHPVVDEACRRFRYLGSIPHGDVLREMLNSDVLVMPSLSEGFGLVITEAQSCGLPTIVTSNAGACDVVHDGTNGFVVPICSSTAIADKLNALHHDRELLREMSRQAQQTAAANQWSNYRARWADVVRGASCR